MKRQDFYYELPEELIAQDPLEDRSSSRLLVLDKETGAFSHHVFKEITEYKGYSGKTDWFQSRDQCQNRSIIIEEKRKQRMGDAGKTR